MSPVAPSGPPNRPLGWGILGTGSIAGSFVTDLARSASGVAVAVGSRSRDGAERFGAQFGIARRHASYEALVADPAVDVVYVATPHPMHHPNTLLALDAGKHVLVEKAFAMNAGEARTMVEAARDRGLFLMEAMWTRFLPHMVEIRRLLAEDALGRVVFVMADLGSWFARDPSSRLFAPELGGSALLDLGVYPVSFASMVLGPPATTLSLVEPAMTGVDGQTSMLLRHPGGAHALLTCTSSATSSRHATIVGTEARIDIDQDFFRPAGFTLITRGGERTRFDAVRDGNGLRHEAEEVARCLAAGLLESPVMPLEETLTIMETMDAVLDTAGARSA